MNGTNGTAKEKFITALEEGASIGGAAKKARSSRSAVYRWRDDDEDFAVRWNEAVETGTDRLEDVAFDRAVEKSDKLLLALLKARRPDKYHDFSKVAHTHKITEIELIAPDEDSSPDTA